MLTAAVLVPETALLVPGAAGGADVLKDVRAAAVAATVDLLRTRPERVVVVVGGDAVGNRVLTGPLRPTLSAAGIDDDGLAWTGTGTAERPAPGGTTVQEVGASVALLLLRAAGWAGEVHLVVAGSRDAAELRALGSRLADGPDRVALLLAGSLSARRGPDGPLPDDPRAAVLDTQVLDDLADGGARAVDRLSSVPWSLVAELAVSAWAAWQVLLGAAPGARADVRWVGAPLGATYAVVSWLLTSDDAGPALGGARATTDGAR